MTNFTLMLAGGLSTAAPMIVFAIAIVIFAFVVVFASRYKKCPSDKIMVIYGKVGTNGDGTQRSAKCIHGGAASFSPMSILT